MQGFGYNQCSYSWTVILLAIRTVYSQQIFTAQVILSNPGTQYVPANMAAQLILTASTNSAKKCALLCTTNILCRIYDYEVFVSKQCRLFEGDTNTLGQIVSSSSPQSISGTIRLSPYLFAEYGQPCISFCSHSRYLQCGNNFTCECMPHTYWNATASICMAQSPILGARCQQNISMCRQDLNYTCLQFNQCGPLSVLVGTTVMDASTSVYGSATSGLNLPYGIAIMSTATDSLIVVDLYNGRVVGIWNVGTAQQNITVITTEWAPGKGLCLPFDVYIDTRNGTDLYLSDYCSAQVMLYKNMQTVNPLPLVVAGNWNTSAPPMTRLNAPFGIALDSHSNLMVASMTDSQIRYWTPNTTVCTILAGLNVNSGSSMGLDYPGGIEFDEKNQWLYVADQNNHRIQRYSINGSWPCNGTTVAGGNGAGTASNQLNGPSYIKLSKKTSAMYIVDSNNHRIQRWEQGATEGVTIAGDPNGNLGSNATMLYWPTGMVLNTNETLMYVTDSSNNRVQRFQLI